MTSRPGAAGTGAQSLTSQIVRAGEISAAVLVLLLLVVTGYALAGRRRRPSRLPAAMAAQWTGGHTQSRYPHAPLTDADRMLELFTAPSAAPDRPVGRSEAPGAPATLGPAADLWQGDSDLFTATSSAGDAARSTGSGPASRAVTSRAAVSGAPPWEPAAQPEGELPWSDGPIRQTVAGEVVASGYPPAGPVSPDSGPLTPPAGQARGHRAAGQAPRNGRASWTDSADRAGSARHAAPAQARQPGTDARSRWIDPAGQPDQDDGFADATWSDQHRSGLPIRQPRPVTPAPLSPSGSLWERAEPMPAETQTEATDTSGRPIFTWDQGAV